MEITNYVSKMFMDSLKKLIFAHPVFHSSILIQANCMSKILIIDDEVQIRSLLARMLGARRV